MVWGPDIFGNHQNIGCQWIWSYRKAQEMGLSNGPQKMEFDQLKIRSENFAFCDDLWLWNPPWMHDMHVFNVFCLLEPLKNCKNGESNTGWCIVLSNKLVVKKTSHQERSQD